MRKWWSKRKYKGDELLNAKWNREDRCWYLHSQYVWHPERNAYLVRSFWEDKIFLIRIPGTALIQILRSV